MGATFPGLFIAGFVFLLLLFKWVNVLKEYERAVTFCLGRLAREAKGPGLVLIFWPFETMVRISMRTVVHDVPTQDIITRDNVSVKVNAVIYFRIMDPQKAVIPNVTLTLRNVVTGIGATATTSSTGYFRFPSLPAASFKLTAVASGFKTTELPAFPVLVGETKTVNITLEVGQQTTVVTVSDSPAMVETSEGRVSTVIEQQKLRDLPVVGRNFTSDEDRPNAYDDFWTASEADLEIADPPADLGQLVGHGAGYGVYEKLKEGLGADVNFFFNADPISIWLTNQKTLDAKLPADILELRASIFVLSNRTATTASSAMSGSSRPALSNWLSCTPAPLLSAL
jgi:hypothetical protein